jgi:peptidyl-prolyl cis-trans isomerase B (cyclophilin B)
MLNRIIHYITLVPLFAFLFFGCGTTVEESDGGLDMTEESDGGLDITKEYYAFIKLEDGSGSEMGTVKILLHADKAPKTVKNFVDLSKDGFYDDVIFHRVIPGFMAQSGDPTGTGSGGPGYTFEDEFHPELTHDSGGMLSMANRGPNTNGSQFFITYAPTPHLDNAHAIFGKVMEGMELIEKIPARDPSMINSPAVKIKGIEIREN